MNRSTAALLGAALCLAGCSKSSKVDPPAAKQPEVLHTTYRAIAGVSMGAIGASTVGLKHPDQFDAVVALGGPLDARFLGRMIEHQLVGGFCSRARLEAALAQDPASLNDPSTFADCMGDVPGDVPGQHAESFNHWHFTSSGGHFTRSSYLDLLYDLTFAFGNLATYNPDSPVAPVGIPVDEVIHPRPDQCSNPIRVQGKLSNPDGRPIYNAEYNPDGKYDAITFCDGEENPVYYCRNSLKAVDFCANGHGQVVPRSQEAAYAAAFCAGDSVGQATDDPGTPQAVLDIYLNAMGRYEPCREHTQPVRVALAFDYNGNGRRDYAEPIVVNNHERYDDVGVDGCPDALEDGHGGCVLNPADSPYAQGVDDPNGDDFHYIYNPAGTEGDWRYEKGEPFRDDGLDGVPNTHDFGEGNGTFDETPGMAKMQAYDPRANYTALTRHGQHQLDVYAEGGIRDVFNFGLAAEMLGGAIRAADPTRFDAFFGFTSIYSPKPGPRTLETVHGSDADWSIAAPNTMEIYGDPNATPAEIQAGEGDHVGTNLEALLRFQFMETWVASRWRNLPPAPTPPSSGAVNGSSDRLLLSQTFFSPALSANRNFSVYLPPFYFDPSQANTRYPVLYMLHGYGQEPDDLATTAPFLFEPPMTSLPRGVPEANGNRYIVVFVSGRCCFENKHTHERDCTLVHDNGTDYAAGWESMCQQGSFYVNASGPAADDAPRYEDSLLDLVQYVDSHYRTLAPADVTAR